jgi:hypothetical protein
MCGSQSWMMERIGQLVGHAERTDLVSELPQRLDHVELRLPLVRLALRKAFDALRRHQRGMDQDHDAQLPSHKANQFLRE